MSSKVSMENQEIINEINGIEYEEDDALTLLDDEELVTTVQDTDDEDLNSFYLDYPTEEETADVVDLYTEKVVEVVEPKEVIKEASPAPVAMPETPVIPTVATTIPQPEVRDNGYQNKLGQLSTNIDAYLNGSLDSRKDEVKVEKMEPVVVKAVTPEIVQQETKNEVNPTATVTSSVNQGIVADNNINNKNIDSNLNQLFAQASDNIRGATDVKRKMEEKYRELQKLYEDFEKKKKADYDEINAYKDEVYNKLKMRKDELDEQARRVKLEQDTLANQKKQFEFEKQKMRDEVTKKEQDMLAAFKEREKSIEQVENGLIKRKEQLDLEKIKIAKERTQCEQEKKELADNLVKFNQLVDDFTKGVDRFNENN